MMLTGRIFKSDTSSFWLAEAPMIGVYTQGRTRAEAVEMLADAVREVVHHAGFAVKIHKSTGSEVLIEANKPKLLAAQVLKYQRETHKLSLADVAKNLKSSSRNAYAAYEQGRTEPTISKFVELLAAVAPEMTLTVGPRKRAV